MEFDLINIKESNFSIDMIHAITNGYIDWAIGGITITFSRSKVVDFTNYINTEPYVVLYTINYDPWMSWLNVISPFQVGVWIILIVSIILISFLLLLSMHVTKRNTYYKLRYFVQVKDFSVL